jgi:DNA-binding response OmpR family regulator
MLRQGLEEQNHTVSVAIDGREALGLATERCFDAIVLDIMLPALDGYAVTRRLRATGSHTPIIMLTARDSSEDIVAGLEAGADDYLVKPFAFSVLIARIRAISRRGNNPSTPVLQIDDLTLDPSLREVTRGGRQIHLTATEFRFLEHLMRRAGRVASRTSIIEAVWGFEEDVELNTVDSYIKLLRDKVDSGHKSKLIQTVRGFGYVMREPV